MMSEEKIRNYKTPAGEIPNSDSIPSFLLKTYEILEVCFPFYSRILSTVTSFVGPKAVRALL